MNYQEIIYLVSSILISYLLGSIPTALLIAKAKGIDIRKQGSGNLGGTNAGRVLGKKFGALVIFIDALKVFIPVMISSLIGKQIIDSEFIIVMTAASCGLAGTIGHCYPIFAKFKGGKSISCTLGFMLSFNALGILPGCIIFIILVLVTKMVSLGSLIGVNSVIAIMLIPFIQKYGMQWGLIYHPEVLIIVGLICLLGIYRHRANIVRIIKGKERKVSWLSRKKKTSQTEK